MTSVAFATPAEARRALALLPDAGRTALAVPFAEQLGDGPLADADAGDVLVAYLFDPKAGAILALDERRAQWLDGPLFTWVGPGNAAPLDDQLAALVAGPLLGKGSVLSEVVAQRRFTPRADDAVALAVAALDRAAQPEVLERMFAERGPDPDRLALSTVQCGRVLAWAPHLLELAIAEPIVDALIALLHPSRPRPLVDAVARALAPIAARPGVLAQRVRAAALATLQVRALASSFLAEVDAIAKPSSIPARYLELPRRELAAASAYILGFAAPLERDAFDVHRALVIDREDGADLVVPFVDGLIAAAHVPAVAELCAGLLQSEPADVATALGLAALIPLDPIRSAIARELDSPIATSRALATTALEMLESDDELDLDAAIALRLGDPSPEVTAAATRSLLARGRRDLLEDHAGREPHRVRRAVVLAGLGDLSVPVVGELVSGSLTGLDELDRASEGDGVSPVTELIAESLLCSVAGLEVACDLIAGVPDAAGLLALASLGGTDRDIAVLAPPASRALLARVALAVATTPGDEELAALALYLLARMSAGDETIADLVADAILTNEASSEGHAGTLLGALGEVRVANAHTAAVLAPFLAADQPIGARVTAAAIAGRVLPANHAAWAQVEELLELGTIARAAAWSALRDRARRA